MGNQAGQLADLIRFLSTATEGAKVEDLIAGSCINGVGQHAGGAVTYRAGDDAGKK
jgi:hypothetical protein